MTDEKMDEMSEYLEKQKRGETPEIPATELPFDENGNLTKEQSNEIHQ